MNDAHSKAPITLLVSFHNNQGYLDNLLASILQSDYDRWLHGIIVIDSNSGAPPRLPDSDSLSIHSVHNPIGSLTTSLNLGLSMVETEWACILDCDTEIVDASFWSIVDYASSAGLSLVIPASLSTEGRLDDCFDQFDTALLGYLFSSRLISPFLASYKAMKRSLLETCEPFAVWLFWGQCIFMNKSLYPQVRFSEQIYVWASDFELSKRLRRGGQRFFCIPKFKIKHHGQGSGRHDSLDRMQGLLRDGFTYVSLAYRNVALFLHAVAIAARFSRLIVRMLFQYNGQKVGLEKTLLASHLTLFRKQYFELR